MCAMHLRDIERFLQGHHLTLNVRNEDDIDMDDIVKKVSDITGRDVTTFLVKTNFL